MREASGDGGGPDVVRLLRWQDEAATAAGRAAFTAGEKRARIKAETAAAHGEMFADEGRRVMRVSAGARGQ